MAINSAIEGKFSLTDHSGRQVTEENYRGRYMLVYFGFTHCRVVCPRSLTKLSAVLESLGEKSGRIAPLYITVDPARDTPERMKNYIEQNFPRFTGLTGGTDAIDRAKKAFRIFAERKSDPDDPDGYAVPHTAIAYLMDPDGKYLQHFSDHLEQEFILEQIKKHLDENSEQS